MNLEVICIPLKGIHNFDFCTSKTIRHFTEVHTEGSNVLF